MRRPLSDSELVGAALGTIAAMCVAGLLGSMRAQLSGENAELLLVLVIIGAAATGGRWAGAITAIASAISFDFFLTEPYRSLAIKSSDDVVATLLLLVIGIAVGQLADDRWRHRDAGQAGTEEVAGLYRVASLAADGAPVEEVLDLVEREVSDVLRLASCHFDVDRPASSMPELQPSGRVDAPYVFQDDGFVLPAAGFAIAVRAQGRTLGWLTCLPQTPTTGTSRDRRRTALVLADHLALAMDRGARATA